MKIKPFFLILTLISSLSAFAYDFSAVNDDGIAIYYNITSKTEPYTAAVAYYSYSGDVNIPESVTYSGKSYSVTKIADSAFSGCSKLTSITIPESIVS